VRDAVELTISVTDIGGPEAPGLLLEVEAVAAIQTVN